MFLNFFSVRRVVAPFQMASSLAKLFACGLIIGVGAYFLSVEGKGTMDSKLSCSNFPIRPNPTLFGSLCQHKLRPRTHCQCPLRWLLQLRWMGHSELGGGGGAGSPQVFTGSIRVRVASLSCPSVWCSGQCPSQCSPAWPV